MGYTHYLYREKNLNPEQFKKVVQDFRKMQPIFTKLGIQLRNWAGDPNKQPEVTDTQIAFNGNEKCGHEQRNLGITWPAKGANGVGYAYERGEVAKCKTVVTMLKQAGWDDGNILQDGETPNSDADGKEELRANDSDIGGTWFAGLKLMTRTCGGDCSHESFVLNRDFKPEEWMNPKENGMYFQCCKTAYKPYDLAVNCAMIIAKHHLKEQIIVHSDGELDNWKDAMQLCQNVLGYGNEFDFDKDEDE